MQQQASNEVVTITSDNTGVVTITSDNTGPKVERTKVLNFKNVQDLSNFYYRVDVLGLFEIATVIREKSNKIVVHFGDVPPQDTAKDSAKPELHIELLADTIFNIADREYKVLNIEAGSTIRVELKSKYYQHKTPTFWQSKMQSHHYHFTNKQQEDMSFSFAKG